VNLAGVNVDSVDDGYFAKAKQAKAQKSE